MTTCYKQIRNTANTKKEAVMFELTTFEIHQAYRERELAAELRDRRLLKISHEPRVAATTRAPASVSHQPATRVSVADR
jgi:hypothetical protein